MPEAPRYNIKSVQAMISTLEGWIEQTEESIGTAEDANSPNQTRIDGLEERLSSLEEARDALQGIS